MLLFAHPDCVSPSDQGRDRWSLGGRRAVRHKQSGYQILPSTPAAQFDLRIHNHLTALLATGPVTFLKNQKIRNQIL